MPQPAGSSFGLESILSAWVAAADPRGSAESMAGFVHRTALRAHLPSVEAVLKELSAGLDSAAGGASDDDSFDPGDLTTVPVSRLGRTDRSLVLRLHANTGDESGPGELFVSSYPRGRAVGAGAVALCDGKLLIDVTQFPPGEPVLVCVSDDAVPARAGYREPLVLERSVAEPGADSDPYDLLRAGFALEAWQEALDRDWSSAPLCGCVSALTAWCRAQLAGALERFPAEVLPREARFLHEQFDSLWRDRLERRLQKLAGLASADSEPKGQE
jgi:hypothetical protein